MRTFANLLTLALATGLGADIQLSAQASSKPQDPKIVQAPKAWPKLSATAKSKVKFLIRKLTDEDAEVVRASEDRLAAIGAGAVPQLLRMLVDREVDRHPAVMRVLDRVVQPEHTPLFAKILKNPKRPAARRWAASYLTRNLHARDQPLLESIHADDDEEVAFVASLGLGGLGKFEHLDPVFLRCQTEWREHAEFVSKVLAQVRGEDAVEWLIRKLRSDDSEVLITGLRFARSLCPRTHGAILRTHLDAENHAVKKAAINALRAVVDGAEPIENLDVFRAIEEAKKWKARL